MSNIEGKIKKVIYQNNDNSYIVALFRVKKCDTKLDLENKTINITGNFYDLKLDALLSLEGEYVENHKYNKMQFNVKSHEYIKPSTIDSILEFLSSSFVEGCGETTAKKIVEMFKEESLNKIKENKENLLLIEGMSESRATKIYNSIINYSKCDDIILKMQKMGFTIDDSSKIINKYKEDIDYILTDDFYSLKELIEFNKLDNIYLQNNEPDTHERICACILQSIELINFNTGNTYAKKDEIVLVLKSEYKIVIGEDTLLNALDDLKINGEIVIEGEKIYLITYYYAELDIAKNLKRISNNKIKVIKNFTDKIELLQKMLNITYDDAQIKAIKEAINSNIAIISGGPGTGKTTIINAIVKLIIEEYKLSPVEIIENIALLAPTGRASKKISQSTGLPAYTIHRYLKWYKETNEFLYNELNKTMHKFVIVDEASMVDTLLFDALLKGISPGVKLILVGDAFQLPSVGPGLVLNDLINTDLFTFINLTKIYRQSDNSYIPYLAKEIKDCDLQEEFLNKKDDYNFIQIDSSGVHKTLEDIVLMARKKQIDETNLQVLAPVYKGVNGIDSLNVILQKLFNPPDDFKEEITFGDVIYREKDKVLQLINDPDNNVYNGDIGFIDDIAVLTKPRRKEVISINFDGNVVNYNKKDLINIKHAYAISVHKSQGSEFDHVVMPICKDFFYMLYNKLLYTGVSRAKKSLILIGDPMVFAKGVQNNYSAGRKTTLIERINTEFLENNIEK